MRVVGRPHMTGMTPLKRGLFIFLYFEKLRRKCVFVSSNRVLGGKERGEKLYFYIHPRHVKKTILHIYPSLHLSFERGEKKELL